MASRKFSDVARPSDLGRFVDAEERDALAAGEAPLAILGVRDDPSNKYAGKPAPRYLFDLAILATGELVTLGLHMNLGRDHMVEAIRETLAQGDQLDPVILVTRTSPGGSDYWTFDDAPAVEPPAELPHPRLRRGAKATD